MDIPSIPAFIVACLASFRQLFVKSNQSGLRKQSSDSESSSNPRSYRIKSFFTHVFNPSSKASSGPRSLLPLQTRPYRAESLFSHNSVENPALGGTTQIDQDFGTSTRVCLGGMEKPVQRGSTTAYTAKARCDVETETEFSSGDKS